MIEQLRSHGRYSNWASAIIIAFSLIFIAGCTSKRKISNVGVRDPRSVVSENRERAIVASEISVVRKRALEVQPPKGCNENLTKYLNKLSLTHLPEPRCPEGFDDRVTEAMADHQLTSEEGLLFESLRKIDCRGRALISRTADQYSIADSVTNFLNRRPSAPARTPEPIVAAAVTEREPSSESERRRLEQEKQEREAALALEQRKLTLTDQLTDDLRRINDRNIAVQKRIVLAGSYLLTEENLRFIINLIDNGCRVQSISNYFARDNASLMAMEHTESLIVDPSLKREFSVLRTMVQGILDEYIKSFF